MSNAYAIVISEENFQAIASEKPNFNAQETRDWLYEHGEGYFIRDPNSSLDCAYVSKDHFRDLYIFESGGASELFRRIMRL